MKSTDSNPENEKKLSSILSQAIIRKMLRKYIEKMSYGCYNIRSQK